jgi:lysophospholipase L1-like esterase
LELLGWAVERRRSGIIYENHGSIGATVRLLEKLDPAAVSFELADRKPALIVIAFGTNEGFRDDIDVTDYTTRFRAAVGALAKRARGAAILVLGPPDGNRRPAECSGDAGCNAGAQANGDNCAWAVPPKLAEIRTVQRRVALRQGWAFWDWSAATGGACGMHRGLGDNPPLAMPDHVHLSKTGYALTADRLFADLMRAYDDWKRAPRRR